MSIFPQVLIEGINAITLSEREQRILNTIEGAGNGYAAKPDARVNAIHRYLATDSAHSSSKVKSVLVLNNYDVASVREWGIANLEGAAIQTLSMA